MFNYLKSPLGGVQGAKKALSKNWKADMISGFLVFLIALPLSLGIAMASGFPPVGGLFTAIIAGMLVTFLGGTNIAIKGPAAGLIVICFGSVQALGNGDPVLGYQLTLAVIVVAGLIQIVFGLVRAGVIGDFFPTSAVHGMLAAIGVIIAAKQIHTMVGMKPEGKQTLEIIAGIPHSILNLNPEIAIIGGISLAIMILLPLIKNKYVKMIPAPMLVILLAIPLGHYFDLEHEHKYLIGTHNYNIGPNFLVSLPENLVHGITFPNFSQILSLVSIKFIVMFALVGTLESLLSSKAVDILDPMKRKSNLDRDLVGVGIGNTLAGLIGGLPMITEIVRSSANINNGAKTTWSNFFHGGFMLAFLVFAPGLIRQIPLSALAALLVYTGYKLASPKLFVHSYKIGKEQLLVFVTTLVTTLATDLIIGILTGIFLEGIIYIFMGVPIGSILKTKVTSEEEPGGNLTLKIKDSAMFSNFPGLKKHLDRVPTGSHLTIDMEATHLVDHSVMEHLHHFETEHKRKGGQVSYKGMEKFNPVSDHHLCSRRAHRKKSHFSQHPYNQ